MQKNQNVTLNCWKFMAALLIMGHHASSIGQKGDYIFHGTYVYTEFFFMVSGFYLTKSLETGKTRYAMDYAKKIWMKLFPYMFITISVSYLISGLLAGSLKECIKVWIRWPLEIFLLNELHIASAQVGQLWYVASMLFVIPFICWLYLKDKDLFKIIIYAVPLIWYGYCYTTWGQLGHRGVFIDLIRASSNLALGGGIFYLSSKISMSQWIIKHKWIVTMIAWVAFIIPVRFTYRLYWTEYDIYCIFYFFVALVFAQTDGFIDIKIKKLNILSDLSMSMYITHLIVARYIQMFFKDTITIKQKYFLYYFITIMCAVFLMMAVNNLKRMKIKNQDNG